MSKDHSGSTSSPGTIWLVPAREAAGLSTRQLARRSGIPKRRLLAIERGKAEPTAAEHEMLASAFGADGSVPATDAASRSVLQEYVSMVSELRNTTPDRFGPVRGEDVAVLADAFGQPPELVHERIAEILSNGDTEPSDPTCA